MVCLKNTGGSDPVHSFRKEFVPFSSLGADLLHGAVGKRYGYWIGVFGHFKTITVRPSSNTAGNWLIEDIVLVQCLNCVLLYSFQRFLDEDCAVFESYITPSQRQDLPLHKELTNARWTAIPSSEKTLFCNNLLISSSPKWDVALIDGMSDVWYNKSIIDPVRCYMRNQKPHFEITNQMIDYVSEIAELVGKLQLCLLFLSI